ncbi:phycobiliprotein lyase [Synechococcus sp. BDU 130192]|uniref:phycobiliprotein lyase n=1 Tax=Synechococcus sp. BDU 130192 TaxID=2042059 RepID=UPI000C07A137|nr:phycobiliprotein lyase [Synechococcus sp. BDU 130192]
MQSFADAKEFFQFSAGQWQSRRVTHHLPFRRAESGGSNIQVETLEKDDPRIIEICQMHDMDASLSVGGSYVTWAGTMQWDKDDENHEGSTVFALIPDADNPRQGKLLRERGYAEIVPVAGEYHLDHEDGLVLTTEYETMTIYERFWFANPDLRLRTSTVKRFGGFNTTTFCMEERIQTSSATAAAAAETNPLYAISGW